MLTLDQLGIHTEATTPLRTWPSILIYAAPGAGKSCEFATAFQDALFVKTSPTVTRPYYSWLRELERETYDRSWHDFSKANSGNTNHPQFKDYADLHGLNAVSLKTGYRAQLSEVTIGSNLSAWGEITRLSDTVIAARDLGHSLPVCGVVVDEFSELQRRIYAEMLASGQFVSKRKGTVNDWAVMDALDAWTIGILDAFRARGLLFGMVCQEAPPSYDENTGALKYKGGPATPFSRLRATNCQATDITLRITLEAGGAATTLALPPPITGAPQASAVVPLAGVAASPPASDPRRWARRRYWTEAHPEWWTKFRDFSIAYREELGLRRLIERAGYL